MRVHPYFIAYLYLHQLAATQGRTTGLKPDWKRGLGPYLEVAGASEEYPYYRPFWNKTAKAGQEWLNKNLAGSFARSSLRVTPLRVVDYDRDTKTFSLRRKHWELARQYLLGGNQLPAEALAAFLLRDYAFITDGGLPTGDDLISLFAVEFGYRGPRSEVELEHLYQRTGQADDSWFEPFTETEPESVESTRLFAGTEPEAAAGAQATETEAEAAR